MVVEGVSNPRVSSAAVIAPALRTLVSSAGMNSLGLGALKTFEASGFHHPDESDASADDHRAEHPLSALDVICSLQQSRPLPKAACRPISSASGFSPGEANKIHTEILADLGGETEELRRFLTDPLETRPARPRKAARFQSRCAPRMRS